MNQGLKLIALLAIVTPAIIILVPKLYAEPNACLESENDFGRLGQDWADGELVVFIRHTEKCEAREDECAEGDKGLTPHGILQAKLIKLGLASLGDSETDFYYSPARRTEETAQYATSEPLHASPWLVEGCKSGLWDKAMSVKAKGHNLVMFTHSSCLNSLTDIKGEKLLSFNAGQDQYFGASILFRSSPANKEELLGCVLPDRWDDVIQSLAAL